MSAARFFFFSDNQNANAGGVCLKLTDLGWNEELEESFLSYAQKGYFVGRVAADHRQKYKVYTEYGEKAAQVAGKMHHQAEGRADYPVVGDWVVLQGERTGHSSVIQGVLPRWSKLSRKEAGLVTEEQIFAANVDTVFLLMALNNDFNLRRIERSLIAAWESGANPVLVLTKADLCADVQSKMDEVSAIALGVPIHVISSLSNQGMEALNPYLETGRTVVLLGSSGVGKSTLVNKLLGEEVQVVQGVRAGDDKGRHTTTHRELLPLPQGGLMIDTPGIRELQLWETSGGFDSTFADIEILSSQCRFSDCQHREEPGCAVKSALQEGKLSSERLRSFQKLQRELAHIAAKNGSRRKAKEGRRTKNKSKTGAQH